MMTIDDVRRGLEEVEERMRSLAAEAVAAEAKRAAAEKRDAEARSALAIIHLALNGSSLEFPAPELANRVSAELGRLRAWGAAAEKRAQDAERELAGSVAIVEAVAEALGLDRHGGDDLPAAVRALKTRRDELIKRLEQDRNDWCKRAFASGNALEERNRELEQVRRDVWQLAATSNEAREKLANVEAERDAAQREAASLRAQLDRARDRANKNEQGIHQLAETVRGLAHERDSLRAQVESLRGEDEPVRLRPLNLEATQAERKRIHNANMEWIASLPSPSSPKTGRDGVWKCRGCGVIATPSIPPCGAWTWDGRGRGGWQHGCSWASRAFPADRIGDAPEVTP